LTAACPGKVALVIGSRAHLFACLATAAVAVMLALAAASPAHQVATLSGGVLTITGDQQHNGQPKPNDLVTIDYDSCANELIFGQDVFGPHPSQCSPDAEHPQRIIHCPASQISTIQINSGIGSDEVDANLPASMVLPVSMGSGNDHFQGGSEVDNVSGGPGSDKLYGGSGRDRLNGGGASDKLFGQGGADKLFGGAAPDKIFGGGGNDHCVPGSGHGKESSC
jgi:Ca2+-binding RTX toxin-like protein